MRSLLAPLILGLVLSLAVVFGVQWSAVRVAVDTGIRSFITDEMVQDADELFGAMVLLPGGETILALAHFDPAFLWPTSGHYYQIMVGETVALRSPSLAGQTLPVIALEQGHRTVANAPGPNRQTVLISANGYDFKGRAVTILVAADMAPVQQEITKLLARYTKVSLVMFVLLVVLQVLIVRVALSPLRRVRADVGRLERGETAQLAEEVPSEVLPLVREVNRLLGLLAHRLHRSRESLGNLAHALKTPLTLLTHMVDDPHVRSHPTLGAQMGEQLATLRERIDSELRRARVASGRAPGPVVDLAAEIALLLETLRKLYAERHLDIACDIDPTLGFKGDREDLLEMCGNLLDNACKWARGQVTMTARRDHGTVLTVEDDGPGCSPEDLEKLARRGIRLDESVEGHGLGLAIARSIAGSYGGTIVFGRSATLGGFQVTVSFPAG